MSEFRLKASNDDYRIVLRLVEGAVSSQLQVLIWWLKLLKLSINSIDCSKAVVAYVTSLYNAC